jgi:Zn-dependent protease
LPEIPPDRFAQFITGYVVLLFSLSVHESAHAWTALRMGDPTAANLGRITLNPLAHIDPIGTVLMPMLQLFSMGIPLLAWAKPTPVQARNFAPGRLRSGQILVAGAGPISNFLLAIVFTLILTALVRGGAELHRGDAVFSILSTGVLLNVFLGVFNLIPLPPLDGSHVASWGLPRSLGDQYDRVMERWGQWILLLAFATGALSYITSPVSAAILRALYWVIFP